MNHYYVLVETARRAVDVLGHDTVSQEVLDAERSATTSGEAIEAVRRQCSSELSCSTWTREHGKRCNKSRREPH